MLPRQGIIYINPKNTQEKTDSEKNGMGSPPAINSTKKLKNQKLFVEQGEKKKNSDSNQKVSQSLSGKVRTDREQVIQEASREGLKEGHKDFKRESVRSRDQFNSIHTSANKNLLECSSVFPFHLFPDKLTIDLHKVNLIYKYLPWSRTVQSIYIDDIAEVDVTSGIFFATLKVTDKFFTHVDNKITFLKKDDAFRARRIIQGLIVIIREKIDIDRLSDEELIAKIEDIGSADGQNLAPTRS